MTGYCGGCTPNYHPVEIGDTDCWGKTVGYIDASGLAWESEVERNISVGAGRVHDGIEKWDDFPVTLEILVGILDTLAMWNRIRREYFRDTPA